MPLILPGPVPHPISTTLEEQFRETRVTHFRFELLEKRFTTDNQPIPEAIVGELQGVTGGSVSWTYNQAVKGGGSLNVLDVGQNISWVQARIRPVAILNNDTEIPVGVFIPSAPTRQHSAVGTEIPIEMLDKCSLLDDAYGDQATGRVMPFSLDGGSDVMLTVKALIEEVGESAHMIPTDLGILTSGPLTWDVATTRLTIINDLLQSAGFFALWCDGMGQFRVTKYVRPEDRPAQHTLLAPFENGNLMSPEWSETEDIYSIPNRFIATTQGDGAGPGLASTAMLDPSSPYSFANRGRWVTGIETGATAVDQQSLDNYAAWRLAMAVSVSHRIIVKHPIIGDFRVNENVYFREEGLDRLLCSIYKTTLPFNPVELCESEIGKVEKVIEDPEMTEPVELPEEDFDEEDFDE